MTIIRKKVRKMQCGGTYKMSVEVGDDHEGKNKTKWEKEMREIWNARAKKVLMRHLFNLHLIDLKEWWKVYVHCVFLVPVLEHRCIYA